MPIPSSLLEQATQQLLQGGLVAFPTETVYGLGADASNGAAVAQIYASKQRPPINPLICHVADVAAAEKLAVFSDLAHRLAARWWPGPLTLVLQMRADVPIHPLVTAGLNTIAIRCPAHPIAQSLLQAVDRPIAAPSANPSGQLSSTREDHVARGFADHPEVLILPDSEHPPLGLESTILDVTGAAPVVLREGAIAREVLAAVLGGDDLLLLPAGHGASTLRATLPIAPGMLRRHYAPRKPIRINATHVQGGEGVLAFGAHPLSGAAITLNLSESGDLVEAAANFYAMLHQLDQASVSAIAVMPIPDHGIGRALNDRLARAVEPA